MLSIYQSGPPKPFPRDLGIYEKMGQDNIYKMIEDFYNELGKSSIKEMFHGNLTESSKKSADFFVFLLGGPPLYHKKHGDPRMKQRHMPFKINHEAQEEWFRCFKKIIDQSKEYQFPQEHQEKFLEFIYRFSLWMVNSSE